MNRRMAVATLGGWLAMPWAVAGPVGTAARAQHPPFYNLDALIADIAAVDLSDMVLSRPDGSVETMAVHAGRLVILNLWATWCPPCVWELPSLGRLAQAFDDRGLIVIAASVEAGGPEAVRGFLLRYPVDGLRFRHVEATGTRRFGAIDTLPTTFIALPDLRAVARIDRAIEWDTPEVRRRVSGWLDDHVPD